MCAAAAAAVVRTLYMSVTSGFVAVSRLPAAAAAGTAAAYWSACTCTVPERTRTRQTPTKRHVARTRKNWCVETKVSLVPLLACTAKVVVAFLVGWVGVGWGTAAFVLALGAEAQAEGGGAVQQAGGHAGGRRYLSAICVCLQLRERPIGSWVG